MNKESYMSGTGNNFIVGIYDREVSDIEIISIVADSIMPVDGVIFVEYINSDTVKMHYFNNDGSPAELCVNGVRCTAKYAVDNEMVNTNNLTVLAPVGDLQAFVEDDYVQIHAPNPEIGTEIKIDNKLCMTSNVGNPHLMVEVDDVDNFDLENFSDTARNTKFFTNGVNI